MKLHGLFFKGKTATAVFSSAQSSNSSGSVMIGDIYTAVVKILGKASFLDRHVKRKRTND